MTSPTPPTSKSKTRTPGSKKSRSTRARASPKALAKVAKLGKVVHSTSSHADVAKPRTSTILFLLPCQVETATRRS
jgi:BRCT domain type II-containing protein